MKQIALVRHSVTGGNLLKRYIGRTDSPLAPEGIALAKRFFGRGTVPEAQVLWASPLTRCLETAEILYPDLTPRIAADLRECDFGEFEDRDHEALKDNPAYREWIGGGGAPPGGESRKAFSARCRRGFLEILRAFSAMEEDKAAVVTHGGTIMAVMAAFAQPEKPFYDWQTANCGGFVLGIPEGWREGERLPLLAEVLPEPGGVQKLF
ncbi:MAG TPA: histidine phosphatase family protein [Candidatus Fimivivens faecavium]|nr:histidine phosphatase family protein [Candidatus Fimivivens faecavium]